MSDLPHNESAGDTTLCAHAFADARHLVSMTCWGHNDGRAVSASFHDVTTEELISMRNALSRQIRGMQKINPPAEHDARQDFQTRCAH